MKSVNQKYYESPFDCTVDHFVTKKAQPIYQKGAFKAIPYDKGYILCAELPGWNNEEIDVSYKNQYLTVKGAVQNKVNKERRPFEHSFHIHERVNPSAIDATLSDGHLEVIIPIHEMEKEQKIKVKNKPPMNKSKLFLSGFENMIN